MFEEPYQAGPILSVSSLAIEAIYASIRSATMFLVAEHSSHQLPIDSVLTRFSMGWMVPSTVGLPQRT
jgi:hypothetical protein